MNSELLNIIQEHGPDKPILSSELEEYLGITGAEVRKQIKALRRKSIFICSCSMGYFMATKYEHIEATIKNLERRADSMKKTAAALRRRFTNSKPAETVKQVEPQQEKLF